MLIWLENQNYEQLGSNFLMLLYDYLFLLCLIYPLVIIVYVIKLEQKISNKVILVAHI